MLLYFRVGDLPRPVVVLQAGNAVNFFGYGLILPFEIIYLHQARGFSTATAGLVLTALMATSAVVAPPTGALLDRLRAKPVLVAANLLSAVGYGSFAFVDRPWQAFLCSAAAGAGLGAAAFIVIVQLPATHAVRRLRRTQAFAGIGVLWAIACFRRDRLRRRRVRAFHRARPDRRRSRAAASARPLSVPLQPQLHRGLALGPALGGALLAVSPGAVWWSGAIAALVVGAGMYRLGNRIPDPLLAVATTPTTA